MTKSLWRWTTIGMTSLSVVALVAPVPRAWAGNEIPAPIAVPQQVATVDQLKSEAFTALKRGNFLQSNELLAKAAEISQDPQIRRMADWMKQFKTQRQEFA